MEMVLIFLLFLVWISFILRRMAMGSRRIRLQEARRQIEIVKRLKRRRAMVALTAAANMASLPVE